MGGLFARRLAASDFLHGVDMGFVVKTIAFVVTSSRVVLPSSSSLLCVALCPESLSRAYPVLLLSFVSPILSQEDGPRYVWVCGRARGRHG